MLAMAGPALGLAGVELGVGLGFGLAVAASGPATARRSDKRLAPTISGATAQSLRRVIGIGLGLRLRVSRGGVRL